MSTRQKKLLLTIAQRQVLLVATSFALLIMWSSVAGEAVAAPQPKRNPNIGYINKDIPSIPVPPVKGKRYEALVPATLDLAERADLAINVLTRVTDAEADYEIYWGFSITNPRSMFMAHDWIGGTMIQPKFMEAVSLMRLITGNEQNLEVDQRWSEVSLHMQGRDGLLYVPAKGRPWAWDGVWPPYKTEIGPVDQHAVSFQFGRMVGAMTLFYLRTGNPILKDAIERLVNRMAELTVDKGTYAYFPAVPQVRPHEYRQRVFVPGDQVSADEPMPIAYSPILAGWSILGLSQFYQATRYEPALTLAGKLAHFVIEHGQIYGPGGRFNNIGGEFHAKTYPLRACLEYAILAKDREMQGFVKRVYEWARTAEGQANPLVGFVPGQLKPAGGTFRTAESCGVADMLAIAVKLSAAGVGDYWDDVDRSVRNQFAESQLTYEDLDWIYRIGETFPEVPLPDKPNLLTDNVAERNVGAFSGWPTANDFCPYTDGRLFMHCCTGNGIRAIYYVWENILDYRDGQLRVNLLLNRASRWADVDSHIPYTGQVDIKLKQPCTLAVRIPEWVKPEATVGKVNNRRQQLKWDGRYALVGKVASGDKVELTFPIAERTVKEETIGGVPYTLIIKGNDVVDIYPPGKNGPLYQRRHYRQNNTLWKRVTRFVSSETIKW